MAGRRGFLIALGAGMLGWVDGARAQAKQPIVIGWLHVGSRGPYEEAFRAFKAELQALSWKEGSEVVIEERWADGRADRLPALATEIVARKPALIVAGATRAVVAAARAAPKTPVIVATGDPLAAGLVSSLARPAGMITGVTNVVADINEKHLELLLETAPKLRRVGFLSDPGLPGHAALMNAARRSIARYSVEGRIEAATTPEEIEPAVVRLAKQDVRALVVMASTLFGTERQRIMKLALARRWPVVAGPPEWAEAGALLSYGTDRVALHRRAAYYVDRILRGAKPGDLPIEQPTKFELVVNMKTAKALGLTIPRPLLMRADRVIE